MYEISDKTDVFAQLQKFILALTFHPDLVYNVFTEMLQVILIWSLCMTYIQGRDCRRPTSIIPHPICISLRHWKKSISVKRTSCRSL